MCLQIFWTFYTILYVKTTKSKYIDHQSKKDLHNNVSKLEQLFTWKECHNYDSMTQVIFG